jgi:hypothetical protein
MAKSAGWAAAGALVALGIGTLYAGHSLRALAWFAVASIAEGVWIGAVGIRTRLHGVRGAIAGPPDGEYRGASWYGPPIIPLVVAATAVAAIAGVKRRPELVGLSAGVNGGFALAFVLIARLYDVQERQYARRYWAPGRGVGGPVRFTGRAERSDRPGS